VHHTIVKKHFRRLINKLKKDDPNIHDVRAERIFYKYLDSYSFTRAVLPLDNDPEMKKKYWEEKYNYIPGGHFSWVKDELIEYFRNIKNAKIGVPQGGALSGLIANIVLDYADNKVIKTSSSKIHYVRFCDDMVIIHPSKKECQNACNVYYNSLKKLHLVPHEFSSDLKNTHKSFWSDTIKSKSPYKWSLSGKNSFPWFGFVGYEINYNGVLRVRKASIIKEKKKQKKIVLQIIDAVKGGKRKKDSSIYESAINKLIGMSVGRLKISNFDKNDNEMCWVNGFRNLKDNPHLRAVKRS